MTQKIRLYLILKEKIVLSFFKLVPKLLLHLQIEQHIYRNRAKELEEIVELFGDFNLLLVEGLKDIPLPRIAIFRNKLDSSYLVIVVP